MANWCDFDITFFPRCPEDAPMTDACGVMAIYAALSDARRRHMSLQDIYEAYPSGDEGAPAADRLNLKAQVTGVSLQNAFDKNYLKRMASRDSHSVAKAMERRAVDDEPLDPRDAIFGYVGVEVTFDSAWTPCLTAILQIVKGILRANHIDPARISYSWLAVEGGNGIYVNTDESHVFYEVVARLRYYSDGDGVDDGLDYEEFFCHNELVSLIEKVREVCDPELFEKAMETESRGGALFGEEYIKGFRRLTSSTEGMKLVEAAFEKLHPDGSIYVDWFETDGSGYEE